MNDLQENVKKLIRLSIIKPNSVEEVTFNNWDVHILEPGPYLNIKLGMQDFDYLLDNEKLFDRFSLSLNDQSGIDLLFIYPNNKDSFYSRAEIHRVYDFTIP